MKQVSLFFFCLLSLSFSFAQNKDSSIVRNDSISSVIVQAFSSKVKWKEAAVAVASLSPDLLEAYAPTSLVPAFNTVAGIRMEERSPGSYRLSIRGSLLRSPFGVRNVKVYWNNLPISDATGNAYLNLVDLNQISGAELIKGPSASVYGAGTGGVVLLQSNLPFNNKTQNQYSAGISSGSFGLFQEQGGWKHQGKNFSSSLQESYLQSDGYRDQSAMHKTALKYEAALSLNKHQLQFLGWYTDLYYQTPGGINLAQMQINSKLARQPAGALPGAQQQQTAVSNKTAFAGLQDNWQVSKNAEIKTFVSVNNTRFENPFITNYEFRNETNTGMGLQWTQHLNNNKYQWITGIEWLYNHSFIADYGNKKGVVDTLQFKDNVFANQWTAYSQLTTTIASKWHLSAGISFNNQQYQYKRVSDINSNYTNKSTGIVPAPRFTVLYDVNNNIAAYIISAYGFSPPSLAELRPSDGNYYGDLAPEKGWNTEFGLKGFLIRHKLQFDIAYYHFQLKDAIVRRNNAAGAEYFVNAGGYLQQGVETSIQYQLIKDASKTISGLKIRTSYSYQPYHFTNYQQGSVNYSGNAVTGVPANIWVSGIDMNFKNHWTLHGSVNAVAPIPLTDANDVFASAYQLVQTKLDYQLTMHRSVIRLFAGIDNLLDQKYSLGNDINAAGKRYYNPAPGRNFYAGFNIQIN